MHLIFCLVAVASLCCLCHTAGRHWARRAAAKMDVVVFGHIFQVRRGGVRGGMVVPWSCLGRVGNVNYGPP